jgi:Protein of unknown function (DUF4232)
MKPQLIGTLALAGLASAACASHSAATPQRTVTVTVTPSAQPVTAEASTASTTATGPASIAPASTAPATPPGCLTRYLNGSPGPTQGTLGSVYVVIRFKNLDNVPCTLYGFPGVATATGRPVTDAGQPSAENQSTARELVTLQPGGYAYTTLEIADAGNYPAARCRPEKTSWLAVIPPNQTIPLFFPFSSVTCRGAVRLMSVTAVRPGDGG